MFVYPHWTMSSLSILFSCCVRSSLTHNRYVINIVWVKECLLYGNSQCPEVLFRVGLVSQKLILVSQFINLQWEEVTFQRLEYSYLPTRAPLPESRYWKSWISNQKVTYNSCSEHRVFSPTNVGSIPLLA